MEENKKFNLLKIIKSKAFIIMCAAILVAAVLAVGISAALNSNPLTQVSKASKNSARALTKSDLYDDVSSLADSGSIGFYWNLRPLTEQLAGYGIDLAVSYKMYANADDEAYYMDIAALIKGEEFVDATVYLNPNKIVATSPILFGDDSYGINLNKLKENFANSAFGENGAFPLGEYVGDVVEEFENYSNALKLSKEFEDDFADLYEEFVTMLMKSAGKHANITKQAGSVAFANETVKTTDIIIKLDKEAFCKLSEDVIKYLDRSDEIEDLIEEYSTVFGTAYDIYTDDVLAEYRAAIDEAMANIDTLDEYIPDIELELTISISKSKKEIVGVNFKIGEAEQAAEINAICGPTWNDISEFRIEATDGYEEFEISYLVKEDTKKAFDAEFKAVYLDETLMSATATWDKESGDIEIAFGSHGYDSADFDFKVEGVMKFEGKKRTFTLDSVELNGQTVEIGGLTVTINTRDKMPSVKKYKDILTMNEEDVKAVISEVEDAVKGLATELIFALQ